MKIATDVRSYSIVKAQDTYAAKKVVGAYHQEALNPETGNKEWMISILTRWKPSLMNPAIDKLLKVMATDAFAEAFKKELSKEDNRSSMQIVVNGFDFDASTNTVSLTLESADGSMRIESTVVDFEKDVNEQLKKLQQDNDLPDLDGFVE